MTFLPGSIYRYENHGQHWVIRVLDKSGKRERFDGSRVEVDAKTFEWRTARHVQKGTKGWRN